MLAVEKEVAEPKEKPRRKRSSRSRRKDLGQEVSTCEFLPRALDRFRVAVPPRQMFVIIQALMSVFVRSPKLRAIVMAELKKNLAGADYRRDPSDRASREIDKNVYVAYKPYQEKVIKAVNESLGLDGSRGSCSQAVVNSAILVVYLDNPEVRLMLVPELMAIVANLPKAEVKALNKLISVVT